MIRKIQKSYSYILCLSLLLALGAVAASAQHGYRVTKRVTFRKGEISTRLAGTIPNTLEVHEYIVRARQGQTIYAKLHTLARPLGFYIMSPSNAMVEEETFLKDYTGELQESGDYHIFVYTTKGSGKYTLDIQIAADI